MYKLVNTMSRAPLNEGRSYGIAFGLCSRKDDTCTIVSPISTCKDYLSDQVYSERSGQNYFIYGFSSSKKGIFDGGETVLAIGYEPYKNGKKQEKFAEDSKKLITSYKKIEGFINKIEDLLQPKNPTKIPHTKIELLGDDRVVAIGDEWWGRYPYLISMYSLLIRVAFYEGHDGVSDPLKKLEHVSTDDAYMVPIMLEKLKKIISNGAPEQKLPVGFCPHSSGIYGVSI